MQYPAVAVSFVLLGLLSGTAHALETQSVSPQTLQAYGATLAESAGSSQWQQLWKRSRDNGMFAHQSPVHFTVPTNRLPDMVMQTLRASQSVKPMKTTQALYRYDFGHPVGIDSKQEVTAICLIVDWRSLPSGTAPTDTSIMGNISLVLASPCP